MRILYRCFKSVQSMLDHFTMSNLMGCPYFLQSSRCSCSPCLRKVKKCFNKQIIFSRIDRDLKLAFRGPHEARQHGRRNILKWLVRAHILDFMRPARPCFFLENMALEHILVWDPAGLNFINVLRTAFMLADLKSIKRYWWLNWIFYAFGI